ncbi:hypothetical protein [Membranihabitans maritimus]|uniref:hypothetical protein n=1 Tax=Membranihabitans maritimus TaxID=2904244 RepID=UPI001F287DB2|nr:hypothetical protein [Membranihabitans maritimus]
MYYKYILLTFFFFLSGYNIYGQHDNVSGIYPHLTMTADHYPRTEAGIGAVMPWANRLWAVTYVAHLSGTGSGTGLYEVDENLELKQHPKSVVGTYANRLIHTPSMQLAIGPYLIDTLGDVRLIEEFKNHRLAATMTHLADPENKLYYLAMEGEFFEVDVHTLEVTRLFQLMDELQEPKGSKPHFKSGFTAQGRVVVCNNSYNEMDYSGDWSAGRLAEWDGSGEWKILEETAFTEVWAAGSFGQPIIATGWDKASAIMRVFINGKWKRYRLPKGSRTFDQTSCTEWMRVREVETERALMDCHGLFYEIGMHTYGDELWAIRPVSSHLRIIPDFCSWRGMLVLAGNQATPMKFGPQDRNPLAGQPQAGLWFGKTDDLWSFGKPSGTGGVWMNDEIQANEISDPYLMYGFDQKVLHVKNNSRSGVNFVLQVDFIGNGDFVNYKTISVEGNEYEAVTFPEGFSAHWARIKADTDCNATAYFIYN